MPTIEEMHRTCNYCIKEFPTQEKFAEHWNKCPVRIREGYIPDPAPPRITTKKEAEILQRFALWYAGNKNGEVVEVALKRYLRMRKRKLEK